MPGGSSHEFRKDDLLHSTPANYSDFVGTFLSVDGTGMRLELGASGQGSTLYLPDGGRYLFSANETLPDSDRFASEFIDVNGNRTQFTRTVNNNRITGAVTDSLGRVLTDPLLQNKIVQPAAGTQNVVLPGLNGSPRNHDLVWANLNQTFDSPERQLKYLGTCENDSQVPIYPPGQTLFQTTSTFNTNVCGTFGPPSQPLFNPVVLSQITMPNGQNYRFKYNEYAEITKIEHPSGAIEKFEYGIVPQFGSFTTPDYAQANRGVKRHWIYENGQAAPQLWDYSTGHSVAPDGSRNELSVFSSPDAVFGFEDPRSGMTKEEKTFDTNGQLRSRTLTDWTTKSLPSTFGNVTRDARPVRSFSIAIDNGKYLATMSETEYETPGENGSTAPTDLTYFAHLNAKRKKSYHYLELTAAEANEAYDTAIVSLKNKFYNTGQVASISETDYSYDSTYKDRGIPSRPIETRVLNPTNVSDVLAKSQSVYDEAAYFENSYTTTNWVDPSYPLRGNVTTARTWDKDNNSWITSHSMYDNLGNVRKVWDTSGDPTRFVETQYSTEYNYAYPTRTIAPAPDPTGVNGTTENSEITRSYDFTTGVLLSVTDALGQTATTTYDDFLRPRWIYPPAGGSQSETIYN
ncbi:MAG: hypothetical protein ABL952_15425, partial [Pyrinomonadaceae bacterium]